MSDIEYWGGWMPWLRHGLRVAVNRCWSWILRRRLGEAGTHFNVDFTARILGSRQIVIGSHFRAGRGFKLVVTNPGPGAAVIRIGAHVALNEYVTIAAHDSLTIGDNVLIGSHVYLGNIGHGSYRGDDQSSPDLPPNHRPFTGSGPIVIGKNVWLGEGSILPGGVTIGHGSIIGAGSVVTKNIPAQVIAVGNPARVIKRFDPAALRWNPIPKDEAVLL